MRGRNYGILMPLNPGQQSKPPQRSNVRISIPIHPSIDAHVRTALTSIANQLSQVTPPKGTIGLPSGAASETATAVPAQGTDLTPTGSQSSGTVLVNASDSVADYLANKIPSTASITAAILSSGGDEQLSLTVPAATTSAPGIVQLEASSADTSASHAVTANDTRLVNVSSLNTLTGAVDLVAGSNVTITPSGSNLTIAATGGTTVHRYAQAFTSPSTTGIDLAVADILPFGPSNTSIAWTLKWVSLYVVGGTSTNTVNVMSGSTGNTAFGTGTNLLASALTISSGNTLATSSNPATLATGITRVASGTPIAIDWTALACTSAVVICEWESTY